MRFLDPLVTEHLAECRFRLWFEFRCVAADDRYICIPAGYETDLLTIPPVLWSIIPPHGQGAKGAVVHDWLLSDTDLSREECAEYFKESLLSLGVSEIQTGLMYAGVRAHDIRIGEEGR